MRRGRLSPCVILHFEYSSGGKAVTKRTTSQLDASCITIEAKCHFIPEGRMGKLTNSSVSHSLAACISSYGLGIYH